MNAKSVIACVLFFSVVCTKVKALSDNQATAITVSSSIATATAMSFLTYYLLGKTRLEQKTAAKIGLSGAVSVGVGSLMYLLLNKSLYHKTHSGVYDGAHKLVGSIESDFLSKDFSSLRDFKQYVCVHDYDYDKAKAHLQQELLFIRNVMQKIQTNNWDKSFLNRCKQLKEKMEYLSQEIQKNIKRVSLSQADDVLNSFIVDIEQERFIQRGFKADNELVAHIHVRFATDWPLVSARDYLITFQKDLSQNSKDLQKLCDIVVDNSDDYMQNALCTTDEFNDFLKKYERIMMRMPEVLETIETLVEKIINMHAYQGQVSLRREHVEKQKQRDHEQKVLQELQEFERQERGKQRDLEERLARERRKHAEKEWLLQREFEEKERKKRREFEERQKSNNQK